MKWPQPLQRIIEVTRSTEYEGHLWLVGGAVRDDLLGGSAPEDFDIVLESSAIRLADFLWEASTSQIAPVVYPRFGTAMVRVEGCNIELVTARRESYETTSRKPEVEPATLLEDAQRRDFTINTLLRNLHDGSLMDPLGLGKADLAVGVIRTPLDPAETFRDDPLRMLRAVRFRWKLGFSPAPGLYEAIHQERERLDIVSEERIRDELVKMLSIPGAAHCLSDLKNLGLLERFAPELISLEGVEQGSYHHLDVWDHSLLVLSNAGHSDLVLSLSALLHDVGKPKSRFIDEKGDTRFFGHETIGAEMAREILRRLKFPNEIVDPVALLVKNHMRLGSSERLTDTAARRLLRDLGDNVERLLLLCEADAAGLKKGVRKLDLGPIREKLAQVQAISPPEQLISPLSGEQIMKELGLEPGPLVGKIKAELAELVLTGQLQPGDQIGALARLRKIAGRTLT